MNIHGDNVHLKLSSQVLIDDDGAVCHLGDSIRRVEAPPHILSTVFQYALARRSYSDLIESLAAQVPKREAEAFLSDLLSHGIIAPDNVLTDSEWKLLRSPTVAQCQGNIAERLAKDATDELRVSEDQASASPRVVRSIDDLFSRRTTRDFAKSTLNDELREIILLGAYGALSGIGGPHDYELRRPVPSAGGLYPVRLYWLQRSATRSLSPGFYRVNYTRNSGCNLVLITGKVRDLARCLHQPVGSANASAAIILACDFSRPVHKYGSRGITFALVEIGHVAQNIQMICASSSVGVWEIGGVDDVRLNALIKDETSKPVIVMLLGDPEPDSMAMLEDVKIDFDWHERKTRQSYWPDFEVASARITTKSNVTDWCWGKDASGELAYLKAVSESVERLACRQQGDAEWLSVQDSRPFLHPRSIVSYPDWKFTEGTFPLRQLDHAKLEPWFAGTRLSTGKEVLVHHDFVYFSDPGHHERRIFHPTTSGVAAYPTAEGAIQRGLLEYMERHIFMEYWRKARLGRRILLPVKRADSRPLSDRLDRLLDHGWEASIVLLSTEPVITVLAFLQNHALGETVVSTASDFHLWAAVDHALKESETVAAMTLKDTGEPICKESVKDPEDHREYYRGKSRYQILSRMLTTDCRELHYDEIALSVCSTTEELIQWLELHGHGVYAVEMTPACVKAIPDFRETRVQRIIVSGLMPMVFGYRMEPNTSLLGSKDVHTYEEKGHWAPPHPFF